MCTPRQHDLAWAQQIEKEDKMFRRFDEMYLKDHSPAASESRRSGHCSCVHHHSGDATPGAAAGGSSTSSRAESRRSNRSEATSTVDRRLSELETMISEERSGRSEMQAQLAKLQSLLEAAIAAKSSHPK